MMNYRIRWDVRLTEREVLRAIAHQDKPASQQDIADSLDCGRRTVQRAIKRLKDKGIVTVVGNSKPSLYQVNTDQLPDAMRMEISRKA